MCCVSCRRYVCLWHATHALATCSMLCCSSERWACSAITITAIPGEILIKLLICVVRMRSKCTMCAMANSKCNMQPTATLNNNSVDMKKKKMLQRNCTRNSFMLLHFQTSLLFLLVLKYIIYTDSHSHTPMIAINWFLQLWYFSYRSLWIFRTHDLTLTWLGLWKRKKRKYSYLFPGVHFSWS